MPAIITHYLCALKALKELTYEEPAAIINKHRNVYFLGAQGPDILFFSASTVIPRLGRMLHRRNVGIFFERALNYSIKKKGREKEMLFSYISGFLSHYALDGLAHPFIFYHSGYSGIGGELSGKYSVFHRRFEASLDTVLINRYGTTPYKLKVYSKIETTKEEKEILGRMLYHALRIFNPKLKERKVKKVPAGLPFFYRITRDKTGREKGIIRVFEKLFSVPHSLSETVHYQNISDDEAERLLNSSHAEWFLPWDRTNPQTASFGDLFLQAAAKTNEYIVSLFGSLYLKKGLAASLKLFGNKSFNSGLEEKVHFDIFNSIYE